MTFRTPARAKNARTEHPADTPSIVEPKFRFTCNRQICGKVEIVCKAPPFAARECRRCRQCCSAEYLYGLARSHSMKYSGAGAAMDSVSCNSWSQTHIQFFDEDALEISKGAELLERRSVSANACNGTNCPLAACPERYCCADCKTMLFNWSPACRYVGVHTWLTFMHGCETFGKLPSQWSLFAVQRKFQEWFCSYCCRRRRQDCAPVHGGGYVWRYCSVIADECERR